MGFQVMPWLFLVRIDKKKQEYFKHHVSMDSPIYVPPSNIHQSRNMEHGQVCQIGDEIKNIYGFEDLRIGHVLIFHWTCEKPPDPTKKERTYFVFEDETYNYYAIDEQNVRGYFDGEKIVPHPNYIFLKNIPALESEGTFDESLSAYLKETETGIVLFSDWSKSPQRHADRINNIKNQIAGLLKSTRTPEIQTKLEQLEKEKQDINKELQKNKFLPYKLAYSNKKVDRDCGIKLQEDDILFCFNKAALYITNFKNRNYSYIVLPTEHIGLVYKAFGKSNVSKSFSLSALN